MTLFIKENHSFVFYSHISSVKYNKHLKHCCFVCMKYTALGEGLMTNIALGFACTIFATRLSPRAVYFIQTGGSALSNTYNCVEILYCVSL